jgi:hypothetical protein
LFIATVAACTLTTMAALTGTYCDLAAPSFSVAARMDTITTPATPTVTPMAVTPMG